MNDTRGDAYTGQLFEGQHVNCGLYYAGPGYIKQISGEQAPQTIRRLAGLGMSMGGNAQITVRFASGYESIVPECIVRGVQWTISDAPADMTEIDRQYNHAVADKAAKAKAKAKHDAQQRAKLPGKYPYLETFEQRKARTGKAAYGQDLAAENIRRDLKHHFPGVKFSVKQGRGQEIRVTWTDGPTLKRVEGIAKRYDAGVMDQTCDYTDYKPQVWHELFGWFKYLFCNRDYSAAAMNKAIAQVYNENGYDWPLPMPTGKTGTFYKDFTREEADMMPNGWSFNLRDCFSGQVYRLLDNTSL